MVPKPSPTPFSAPFVSEFRVERNGNKLKIAQFKSLSTAEHKKISNIEKIPDFFQPDFFFHKFRLSNAFVNQLPVYDCTGAMAYIFKRISIVKRDICIFADGNRADPFIKAENFSRIDCNKCKGVAL